MSAPIVRKAGGPMLSIHRARRNNAATDSRSEAGMSREGGRGAGADDDVQAMKKIAPSSAAASLERVH